MYQHYQSFSYFLQQKVLVLRQGESPFIYSRKLPQRVLQESWLVVLMSVLLLLFLLHIHTLKIPIAFVLNSAS